MCHAIANETVRLGGCMRTAMRELVGAACLALGFTAPMAQAADTGLVYDKNYQCGTEIIQVGGCRRDSDTPDMPPTQDSDNFCQVCYPSRPKNGIGGTAFGIELRGDLEKQLRACGALASPQSATTAPRARRSQSSGCAPASKSPIPG